jgi:hypothetical protein
VGLRSLDASDGGTLGEVRAAERLDDGGDVVVVDCLPGVRKRRR